MTKYMPFYYDGKKFLTNQKCFIITGEYLEYLTAFFNSNIFKICYRNAFPELQGGTRELSKIFFDALKIPKPSDLFYEDFKNLLDDVQNGKDSADLRIDRALILSLNLENFEDFILNYHV